MVSGNNRASYNQCTPQHQSKFKTTKNVQSAPCMNGNIVCYSDHVLLVNLMNITNLNYQKLHTHILPHTMMISCVETSFLIGGMPFLSPNQQGQGIEGIMDIFYRQQKSKACHPTNSVSALTAKPRISGIQNTCHFLDTSYNEQIK